METGKTGSVRMPNNFDTVSMDDFVRTLGRIVNQAVDDFGRAKRHKIYLAGPWFDAKSRQFYDAVTNIYSLIQEKSEFELICPRDNANETPSAAFNNNVSDLQDCDLVVAMVSKKDVGTAWEIGYAYSLGKPIYLLGYDKTTFLSHTNVMLAFTGECFTIDDWAKFLLGMPVDFVQINDEWEGIE
jgi:nucleoside 2-deoxyribosyltransferase